VAGAASRGGASRWGEESHRGDAPHRGRRCASVRADVGAAELAGGRRRCCARVGEERRGASERSDVARRRRGARRGQARRGEAVATTTEEERRFGGKWLSADLEGDGAYIEPRPFVTGHIYNHDKRPFSLGSYYDPRLKAPLLSRVASRPVTKGAFRAECPEGEFSPFSLGWCYHP
jgi:hypothetical protein